MADLPSGTVTFLFTDIEGSTSLWERDPQGMRASLEVHNAILNQTITARAGRIFKIIGDSIHKTLGKAIDYGDQADLKDFQVATRAGLNEQTFTAAWSEGQAMTLGQAVAYALEGT